MAVLNKNYELPMPQQSLLCLIKTSHDFETQALLRIERDRVQHLEHLLNAAEARAQLPEVGDGGEEREK